MRLAPLRTRLLIKMTPAAPRTADLPSRIATIGIDAARIVRC
jgi:hypothetical protein